MSFFFLNVFKITSLKIIVLNIFLYKSPKISLVRKVKEKRKHKKGIKMRFYWFELAISV